MTTSKTLTLTVTIPVPVPDMTDAELRLEVWEAVIKTAALSHQMSMMDLFTDPCVDADRRNAACVYHKAWIERLASSTFTVERNA